MNGFCYYLNQGDFTFGHPTDLLWDGCKCCGVNNDIEDDIEENMEECEEEYITTDTIEDNINETKIEKDENNIEIARGIANYDSDDCSKILGMHSDNIYEALGHKNYDAVITKDNIALI